MTEGDELLGRWAAVMLNADAYAELIDRHVELASELFWLDGLLNSTDPSIGKRTQTKQPQPSGALNSTARLARAAN